MAKTPKAPWSSMTKAELIKTIMQLEKQETKLRKSVDKLTAQLFYARVGRVAEIRSAASSEGKSTDEATLPAFPWDSGPRAGVLPNPFDDPFEGQGS